MLADITLFQFMENNPWLTFFLALITLQTVIYVVRYIAYAIQGQPEILNDDEEE
jgi:hypothetical protein